VEAFAQDHNLELHLPGFRFWTTSTLCKQREIHPLLCGTLWRHPRVEHQEECC